MKIPRLLRILLSLAVFTAFAWPFAMGVTHGNAEKFSAFFKFQLGPALVRGITHHASFAVLILIALLWLTFLFGRFYCAFFCPLGILQDCIGWLKRSPGFPTRKTRKAGSENLGSFKHPHLRLLRYLIALTSFAILTVGWAVGFKILDPYSIFGRMASATLTPVGKFIQAKWFPLGILETRTPDAWVLYIGWASLALLVALVIWKRRIFCNALCPVGTLLGVVSSRGIFKLKLHDCVKCGKCVDVCPSGSIDPENNTLDNERCLRCMSCLAACKPKCIKFTAKCEPVATEPSRRNFLTSTSGLIIFGSLYFIRRSNNRIRSDSANPGVVSRLLNTSKPKAICPPGAGSPQRFSAFCTGCALCVANCTGRTLQGANPAKGILHPHLCFEKGFCEPNCMKCSQLCPVGALRPMTLAAKKRTRVGLARFDEGLCVAVVDGTHCGACAEHCPTEALHMVDYGTGTPVPELNEALCTGCGACEYICPVKIPHKAIYVEPVSVQVEAADPAELNKRPPPEKRNTDDWLI